MPPPPRFPRAWFVAGLVLWYIGHATRPLGWIVTALGALCLGAGTLASRSWMAPSHGRERMPVGAALFGIDAIVHVVAALAGPPFIEWIPTSVQEFPWLPVALSAHLVAWLVVLSSLRCQASLGPRDDLRRLWSPGSRRA